MADHESLKILRGGVEKWNAWRDENEGVRPDLEGANLSRRYLASANLTGLSGAKLHGANLSNANLTNAKLPSAHLNGANLVSANLVSADLTYADLSSAKLENANLRGANLTRANLIDADLTRANLTDANLSNANLTDAKLLSAYLAGATLIDVNLPRADLAGAHLRGANLHRANLNGANLNGSADLEGVNFTYADLTGADLVDSHLAYGNLTRTILTNANLSGAHFDSTTVADIDLRQVKGLDTTRHNGPSPISTSTFQLSQGHIPAAFLRGCGLSDWEIEAANLWNPGLTEDERTLIHYEILRIQGEQPIMQHRLFISYAHKDTDFVEALERLLDSKGIRYWRDTHDLKAGRLEPQIDRGITLNPLVLLILSENSVRSDWVEHEATSARELERKFRDQGNSKDVLCPIALDTAWKDCDWPRVLRRQIEDYNILDFSGWKDLATLAKDFAKLYDGLLLNY